MAHRIINHIPQMISRPPTGWRKPIPWQVKLQVVINQRGMAPDGTPLDAVGVGIHFDHRPPLHEREFDELADDTIPSANDIRFILALPAPLHRMISALDLKRMRKTQRQYTAEITFRKNMEEKRAGEKRKIKKSIFGRRFERKKIDKI